MNIPYLGVSILLIIFGSIYTFGSRELIDRFNSHIPVRRWDGSITFIHQDSKKPSFHRTKTVIFRMLGIGFLFVGVLLFLAELHG